MGIEPIDASERLRRRFAKNKSGIITAIAVLIPVVLLIAFNAASLKNMIYYSLHEYYAGMDPSNLPYVGAGNYIDFFTGEAKTLFRNEIIIGAMKLVFGGAYVFLGTRLIGRIKNNYARGAFLSVIALPIFMMPLLCARLRYLFLPNFNHFNRSIAVLYDAVKAGGLCIVAAAFFSNGGMTAKKALYAALCYAAFTLARFTLYDVNFHYFMRNPDNRSLIEGFGTYAMGIGRMGNYSYTSAINITQSAAALVCGAGLVAVYMLMRKRRVSFIEERQKASASIKSLASFFALIFVFMVLMIMTSKLERIYEIIFPTNPHPNIRLDNTMKDILFIAFSTASCLVFGVITGYAATTRAGLPLVVLCALFMALDTESLAKFVSSGLTDYPFVYRWLERLPMAFVTGLGLALMCGCGELTPGGFLRKIKPILPFTAAALLYFNMWNYTETMRSCMFFRQRNTRLIADVIYNYMTLSETNDFTGGKIETLAILSLLFALAGAACIMANINKQEKGQSIV